MRVRYFYSRDRSRLYLSATAEEFDGRPLLQTVWFEGVNGELNHEAVCLAAWLIFAPFVSYRLKFEKPVLRPLVDQIVRTWGAPLEIMQVDEQPKAYPKRQGSLVIVSPYASADQLMKACVTQPIYQLEELPLSASGTVFLNNRIQFKSNVRLHESTAGGQMVYASMAAAIVYADYMSIQNIACRKKLLDAAPPTMVGCEDEHEAAWVELLKHAGFNLLVSDV